jgi:hypothetical protein
MGVSAIVGGVAAVASVAGTAAGMIGGGGGSGGQNSANTLTGASGMTEAQMARAVGAIGQNRDLANADIAPWRTAGEGAVNQIGGLLSLPGYTALDPTTTLTGTPGYQFLRDQGTEALRRYGAGTGLLSSGAGMKGALDYGQKLAQTYAWQPYMSSLQNLSGQGLQAGTSMGNWDMQAGMGEANIYSQGMAQQNQLAQQQAQLQMQQDNMAMGRSNDMMSGIGYGINRLGSAFGNYSSGSGRTILPPSSGVDNSWWNSGVDYQPGGYGYQNVYMADGGPTEANRPYIVGERGPELFVPRTAGYVIPNEYTRYSSFGRRY